MVYPKSGRGILLFVGSGVHGELSIASPRGVSLPKEALKVSMITSSEGHTAALLSNLLTNCTELFLNFIF